MKNMLNKVPAVTIYFWIIKVLCTTVGETASDFLSINLSLGLYGTAAVMGVCLLAALVVQFKARKYIPSLYWLSVVLISIFGTLLTDILTDNLHFPLEASTVLFSVALAATFAVWYAKEGTLSIHSIDTRHREAFYWLAILFTFALGTAAGDLMAEALSLGYLVTGLIVCSAILIVLIAWRLGLDGVLAFWIVYILTRPLGASLGDYLTQSHAVGGLGFGAAVTSAIFLTAILAVVVFLTLTRYDFIATPTVTPIKSSGKQPSVIWQVVGVVAALVIVSSLGYYGRSVQLAAIAVANAASPTPLGDLSDFRQITVDTLSLARAGDLAGAKKRIKDLETAWDNAEPSLRPKNPNKWSLMDGYIDNALKNLRASQPDATACTTTLQTLLDVMNTLDPKK